MKYSSLVKRDGFKEPNHLLVTASGDVCFHAVHVV